MYKITDTKNVQTQNGDGMVLTVLKKCVRFDVWAPERLRQKPLISEIYPLPPFYVRPLGLKPCKNSKNKYHAYDIAVPSWIADNSEVPPAPAPRAVLRAAPRVQKKK